MTDESRTNSPVDPGYLFHFTRPIDACTTNNGLVSVSLQTTPKVASYLMQTGAVSKAAVPGATLALTGRDGGSQSGEVGGSGRSSSPLGGGGRSPRERCRGVVNTYA